MKNQSGTGFFLSGMFPVPFSKWLLFYPASGYRLRASGALSSVGTTGVSWSSSPGASGSANAGILNFTAARVSPLSDDSRTFGLPVRCVRVFATASREGLRLQSYPASGYRNRASGALASVGSGGWSWGSATYASGSVLAGHLNTSATNVYPLYYNYRTYGFPVRCVREFTATSREGLRLLSYPASGYRLRASGALTLVGSEGDSWSSAPFASASLYAGSFVFRLANVSPLLYTSRVFGLPVRCVRAFTTASREGLRSQSYPASGSRHSVSGALSSVGTFGLSWGSSPNTSGSVSAGVFYFLASVVNPLDSSTRSFGFPVRCVREFATA